jgi:cob(I)alamin adenosyltransferase
VKIYTRTGDDGTTGVLGPGRVRKSDPRIEAGGAVDELNAALGVARAAGAAGPLAAEIAGIQSRLFTLGAELATTAPGALAKLERIADEDIAALERIIDRLDAQLPPLENFILPGGGALAAQLHLARAVCRRAERRVVALAAIATVEPRLIRFLNRLADLLFVMARECNRHDGVTDVTWRGGRTS